MTYATDSILHCDQCGEALYRVELVPATNEGVFTYRTVALQPNLRDCNNKCPACECGLTRKPA